MLHGKKRGLAAAEMQGWLEGRKRKRNKTCSVLTTIPSSVTSAALIENWPTARKLLQ